MNLNKKGFFPRWYYIPMFFFLGLSFIFTAGMYDFTIVEVYEPVHVIINNSLANTIDNYNTSVYNIELENNSTEVHNNTLPFNYLYMFLFVFTIVISLTEAARDKKQSIFELIFGSIGGIIFLLYIMHIIIFNIVEWFKIQILDQIFVDLINSYIPFYNTLMANLGIIILLWAIALILVNWFFGNTQSEFSGVFGSQ